MVIAILLFKRFFDRNEMENSSLMFSCHLKKGNFFINKIKKSLSMKRGFWRLEKRDFFSFF